MHADGGDERAVGDAPTLPSDSAEGGAGAGAAAAATKATDRFGPAAA